MRDALISVKKWKGNLNRQITFKMYKAVSSKENAGNKEGSGRENFRI